MPEHPEPPPDNPDNADIPVPGNRRERRGGKSELPSYRGGKSAGGRIPGNVPTPRQYSTRRRGG